MNTADHLGSPILSDAQLRNLTRASRDAQKAKNALNQSYQVSESDRWYDIEDINKNYQEGIRHGRVEGIFYGWIIACMVAIVIITSQM